ncbi:MAG: GH92 family glycosyl hydrolase [Flavobacteriales bacterium]
MKSYLLTLLFIGAQLVSLKAQQKIWTYVNPMVGTDFNGHTFPGATVPFGMVQLSPDTRIDGSWEGCSGYHYSDSIIYGFSHTHLSGTGVSDYGDILIMPQLSNPSFEHSEYAAEFTHNNETAEAGYYNVVLKNGINVNLTATTRAGFHHYTFPQEEFSVILDLDHRDYVKEGEIKLMDNKTISVKRISSAWAQNQHCYAHLSFSEPFESEFNETKHRVILRFKNPNKELKIKIGLSFTGAEGARKNLQAEIDHWDFERTRDDARIAWNQALSKIEVKDPNTEKVQTFYTALYHTMIHPNVAMDVDGSYRGHDMKIHKAEGFTYYTVFSLWDTFRAAHPLFTIIERERTLDFIKTFLAIYQQGGRLPVWELCANETDCMIGYHSVSVISDALNKGITDFNVELAYQAMCSSANWDHYGLTEYKDHGFLSVEDEHESVSKTLEYAYDDWCIAQVAQYLDKEDDMTTYLERSNSWRNLMDNETRLMRPRMNGGWMTPFDPREVNNHFTEGNSWQYSFFVPQNISGMIEAMGGPEAFEKQLDGLFSAPDQTTGRTQVDISGLIGQYAHGNEPSHHITWLYNYIDKPEKTKARVHKILQQFYTSKPNGLIGNEDCGQMSAWYVMAAMGIYAVTPGEPRYALCEPYLEDYTVHLESGKSFSKSDITAALKNGLFIDHFALTREEKPDTRANFTSTYNYIQPPTIQANSISFDDSLAITIEVADDNSIQYQFPPMEALHISDQSKTTFFIHQSTRIQANAVQSGPYSFNLSKPVNAHFYKNPHPDWTVELNCTFNPQYSAGGTKGLIDGIRGDKNWRKGYWQGYQDQDFEAIIDMQRVQSIQAIAAGFLQDTRSWIVYPTNVEFFVSEDGKTYTLIGKIENTVKADDYKTQTQLLMVRLNQPREGRYVKVVAKNFGTLPEWHQGAGGEAFIFVDEITID